MEVKRLIEEIEKLPIEERSELYSYVVAKIKRKEHLQSVLESVKGSGKGVWDLDAQEYVNRMRSEDRF